MTIAKYIHIYLKSVFFFVCVKIKSVRETIFCPFFHFFSRAKKFFTHTFLNIFTGTLAFSRALSKKISRIDFDFSRVETQEFSRKGSNFHAYSFRYLDAQIAQNLNCTIIRAALNNSHKS